MVEALSLVQRYSILVILSPLKHHCLAWWWHMLVMKTLRRLSQEDFMISWVWGQPGLLKQAEDRPALHSETLPQKKAPHTRIGKMSYWHVVGRRLQVLPHAERWILSPNANITHWKILYKSKESLKKVCCSIVHTMRIWAYLYICLIN